MFELHSQLTLSIPLSKPYYFHQIISSGYIQCLTNYSDSFDLIFTWLQLSIKYLDSVHKVVSNQFDVDRMKSEKQLCGHAYWFKLNNSRWTNIRRNCCAMGNQSKVKAWELKWVQLTSSNMSQSVPWEIEFNLSKYIVTKCVIMDLICI